MPITLPPLSPFAKGLLFALLSYVLFLSWLAYALPEPRFKTVFSETGFFEILSIVFWLVAAVCALIKAPIRRIHIASAMVFVFCAMREADWHKKFTSDGTFKLKYYTKSLAPLSEKIPAACVTLLFIILIAYTCYYGLRCLKNPLVRRAEATWIMILGVLLFFAGKVLDRSLSILSESFDIVVSPQAKQFVSAYEEGLEMITPLLIAIAFLLLARRKPQQAA